MQPAFILIIALAALFIGLSKGGLGGPVPVAILTPLLSQIMPAAQAVGIVLPLLLVGDIIALTMYWKRWDSTAIRRMLIPGIIGVAIGGWALLQFAESGQDLLLRRIIGLFTLLVVVYKVGGGFLSRLAYQPRVWHSYVAGWAAGFGSALANVGAPPFTAYMMLQNLPPVTFIGTATLFFAIINALKLPVTLSSSKILDLHLLLSIAWAAPIIPVGVWLGHRLVKKMNPAFFDWIMIVILFGMSLFMLLASPR